MQPEEVRDATALIKALDAIDPVISTDYPCAFIDANGRLCPNMALLRVPDGTMRCLPHANDWYRLHP